MSSSEAPQGGRATCRLKSFIPKRDHARAEAAAAATRDDEGWRCGGAAAAADTG